MNHANFSTRLTFIRNILLEKFSIVPLSITPVDYDPECAFPYNNFVYVVEFSPVISSTSSRLEAANETYKCTANLQHGTVPLPNGTEKFIVRLTNSLAGLNDGPRVENEVCGMEIARRALQLGPAGTNVVPDVYGWGSAGDGKQGWIAMQYMEGGPLDGIFSNMSEEEKKMVMIEVVGIWKRMRGGAERILREGKMAGLDRVGYGGLGWDHEGKAVSAASTVWGCEAQDTYEGFIKSVLRRQLFVSDESPVLRGWRDKGLRVRLERFIEEGVDLMLANINTTKKTLIHGDFTLNNILFDSHTNQITALIDFDWCTISHPADELLRSFDARYARLPHPYERAFEKTALRGAMLRGFMSPMPTAVWSGSGVSFQMAKMWSDALEEVGLEKPGMVEGIEELSRLWGLVELLAPWELCNEVVVGQRGSESLEKERGEVELMIGRFLMENGI